MEVRPAGRFLRSGKVKDIYENDDDDQLVFHFTDRVSAFDVILPTTVPRKGELLCRLGAHFFETLGIPNHMVRTEGADRMVVRKMDMVKVECVVRGYLYGSLMERVARGEVDLPVEKKVLASRLPQPYFDPTTKSEVKDEPITEEEIVAQGRTGTPLDPALPRERLLEELDGREVDSHVPIGVEQRQDRDGDILLGDSIGTDEFRLWPAKSYSPGRSQESYDKQPIRDWLASQGYKAELDAARKSGRPAPVPPSLPGWLVEETARRYAAVYETFSGKKF